jgi:NAD-dependent dihydropyrimidine dehydrogenase PreA subunit
MRQTIFSYSVLLFWVLVFNFSLNAQTDSTETFQDADEFTETVTTTADDEFSSSSDDEFEEFEEDTATNEFATFDGTMVHHTTNWNRFYWALGILLATLIAGIFVHLKKTRFLRPLFLLAAVVVLGFYRGGPGIISSFQNTILVFLGYSDAWPAIILFLGVIILTYFFGRVFCGWTCYLGAIQEFLHIGKFKIFQSKKAQRNMRIVRYVALTVLVVQLIITHHIEWYKIGPFKVLFNLFSPNLTGYILLGILLVSSLFIHKPFCKMFCPVGLILGWVTKIPGASVLGITDSCNGCKSCNIACNINAITRDGKVSELDNQECVMCGECMNDCRVKSIGPFRNSKKHKNQIVLKGIKKVNLTK